MRAFLTLSWACAAWIVVSSPVVTGEQIGGRIVDVTAARGVVDSKPDRPTTLFSPEDNPIYVWFRAEGCAFGTTIRSIWYYEDTDPPLRFTEGSVTVDAIEGWGQFNFELRPGLRWPIGDYRVELRVGDTLLAETAFRVAVSTRHDH